MANKFHIDCPDSLKIELCNQLADLQRVVWDMSDLDILPPWAIMITPKIGGKVITASLYDKPIGLAILNPVITKKKKSYYLSMIGVDPSYRNQGIAEELMMKTKSFLSEGGFQSIEWTFDPLEGANANLYIKKLGARGIQYHTNYYGELSGKDTGTDTDRLWVEWKWNDEPEVQGSKLTVISKEDYESFEKTFTNKPEHIAIEIPADFIALKNDSPEEAQTIRRKTRKIFIELFKHGYIIDNFLQGNDKNHLTAFLKK